MTPNIEKSKLSLQLNGMPKIEKNVMQITENGMLIELYNKSKNNDNNLKK